ncbi:MULTISPECIES: helix-turn-helix domain-containing protein [unclassified Brevibacterium]|uniref:helix-turn-helix domain-containing protein n=1 Tax=unclassified Brevibacterium TaxID=2614124 RepID=UPI00365E25FC
MINLERLLTAKQVAEILNCSVQHVYRLRGRGDLPAIAVGGMYRYSPEELRRYIDR